MPFEDVIQSSLAMEREAGVASFVQWRTFRDGMWHPTLRFDPDGEMRKYKENLAKKLLTLFCYLGRC